MSSLPLGPRETALNAEWVPDEEVKECPLCSKGFSLSVRRHHCRACGRVICGTCSGNQLRLPGSSSQQRVCEPCFELHQHDKAAALTEQLTKNRLVEASLRADLKEKHAQAEWFKSFLARIDAEAAAAGLTESEAEPLEASAAAGTQPEAECVGREEVCEEDAVVRRASSAAMNSFSDHNPEVQGLIACARRQWKNVISNVQSIAEENQALQESIQELERESRERTKAVAALRKTVRGMESDLKGRSQVEAHRDELKLKVDQLELELEGLTRRIGTLESSRPSTGSFTLSSIRAGVVPGSNSGSFVGGNEGREPCRERCQKCNLM